MVKHVLGINSNIQVLAFRNLNILARRHIQAPPARSDKRIRLHVPHRSWQCMVHNNRTGYRVAIGIIMINDSQRFDI